MKPYQKNILRIGTVCLSLCLVLGAAVLGLNGYVKGSAKERILTPEEAARLSEVDCILVLGCLVKESGEPSDMLMDRVTTGISLYESGVSQKLLMSGDHGREDYDEVGAMKRTATEAGVPSEDVFCDHAGFSTYESLIRAKEVFGAQRIVIVTQEYHLYRALHIARELGLEAYGVGADVREYGGQWMRELREILARVKDVFTATLEPDPKYLGEPVSLDGDGNITNG